ncbi:Crp/Fnr family transcriptional regulator [Halocynthiibacter sp.]|uniref:Crp/Fnr family transcriptional regulator n=1 Tax=Halocynthiibacter sp. TaxID=1979210 RepID=UPI003C4F92B6
MCSDKGQTEMPQNDENELATRLKKNGLFTGVTDAALRDVMAKMHLQNTRPGQIIIHAGDMSDQVYFLIEGSVLGQMVAENGREVMFTRIQSNFCFGEMAALDGHPRSITVSSHDHARLAVLTGADFRGILNSHAVIASNLATEMTRRLRYMNERLFGLIVYDDEARVRLHLLRLAQEKGKLADGAILDAPPTHEEIASYVGANREAVSRAIAKLKKSGAIKAARKSIQLLDCNALLDGLTPATG